MSRFFICWKKRQNQLQKQKEIDSQLRKKCTKPCPTLVNELLFHERKWNRDIVNGMSKCNLEEYVKSIKTSYNKTEEHYTKLQNILTQDENPCQGLREYLLLLQKRDVT